MALAKYGRIIELINVRWVGIYQEVIEQTRSR